MQNISRVSLRIQVSSAQNAAGSPEEFLCVLKLNHQHVSGYLQGCVCVCVDAGGRAGDGGFISSCRWPRLLIHRSGEKRSPPRVKQGRKQCTDRETGRVETSSLKERARGAERCQIPEEVKILT